MESSEGDGPDASSLGPVSSLRARFESANRPDEAAPASQALAQPSRAPSRPISPAPKPEKLKNFKPAHDVPISAPSTPTVPSRPKPKLGIASSTRQQVDGAATAPLEANPSKDPTYNPNPPAVTIQPPQSPPKGRVWSHGPEETPTFLNPDAVTGTITPGGSAQHSVSPGRPTTPTSAVPAPRSPRGSRPPSPPPPRRSGEIKREPKQAPPPPAPRREKASGSDTHSVGAGYGLFTPKKQKRSTETSPFNSPPGSPEADGPESPPQLPTRPRPQAIPEPPSRPRSAMGKSFEPPPVHHAVQKKRDRASETNGTGGQAHTGQWVNGDLRPGSLPKHHGNEPTQRPVSMQIPSAPPRPPRASPPEQEQAVRSAPGKRVSSNPSPQQQLHVPPTRTHGRSMTVNSRPAERQAIEAHPVPIMTVAAPKVASQNAAMAAPKNENLVPVVEYPDCSSTNRRPPFGKKTASEIQTRYDPRVFDVCGELVCTSGQLTRLWSVVDGDLRMSLAHTEGVKATSVAFKPSLYPQSEASAVWVGTNMGEILEVDLATHTIVPSKGSIHQRREVTRIYRHHNEMWTLDELGTLHVWGPKEDGLPDVTGNPSQSYKMPKEQTFSMVVGSKLWHATGKEIRVFAPTLDGHTQFQVLMRPMIAEGAGDVTSGTLVKTQPGKVFFGHADGKVSIFSTKDYSCIGVLSVSTWKMNALAGVGHRIWIGYNTGKICVYDIGETPWTILKEWQAHLGPVISMKSDPAGAYRLDRLQVVSLGADNKLKFWDGMLEDDWIEDEMKSKDTEYCDFDELRALVFTWNAGASTPSSLRYSANDGVFFPELLQSSKSPDILIFGFQELVDLEDKTATAKRFLKVKKKEGTDQETMSHQYRDWKNYLVKTLDDYMPPDDLYQVLHTAPLVGLFLCVFVKASLRGRIRNVHGAEVKRGMGGLHGNKGAVAVRFQIDDSSLCFVNCHLAAGQTQTNARNSDVAEILESGLFPTEKDTDVRIDTYAGGGDGSLVVDHELCVLNGDLNYRIHNMSRDTVAMAVKQNNLGKLLERDQLLVARRRNPTFKLRAFEELPITFAPTYKYDVGTDRYDTSEKRRSPAWCDRLLFRGRGRVQQLDYRRHEVYVSDHRPVTGDFRFWVKKVRRKDRAVVWQQSQQSFETVRQKAIADEKLHYLMLVCGYDETTSKRLIREQGES